MPFYALACLECKCYFELGVKTKIDINGIICPGCGSPDIEHQNTNDERGLRIDNLVQDVGSLTSRVAKLWEFYEDITGEGTDADRSLANIHEGDETKKH